jgi:hypothetical protein
VGETWKRKANLMLSICHHSVLVRLSMSALRARAKAAVASESVRPSGNAAVGFVYAGQEQKQTTQPSKKETERRKAEAPPMI